MNSTTSAESPETLTACGAIRGHPAAAEDKRGVSERARLAPSPQGSFPYTAHAPIPPLHARFGFCAQLSPSRGTLPSYLTERERECEEALAHRPRRLRAEVGR